MLFFEFIMIMFYKFIILLQSNALPLTIGKGYRRFSSTVRLVPFVQYLGETLENNKYLLIAGANRQYNKKYYKIW